MRERKNGRITAFMAFGLMGFIIGQPINSAQAQSPRTFIKTDDGVIMFMVDGQEREGLDVKGLHTHGEVNNYGVAIDTVTGQPFAAVQKAGA